MACYKPHKAWMSKWTKPNGKASVIFGAPNGDPTQWDQIEVPCGKCVGCKEDYAVQWSVRIMSEAQMWPDNTFVTLTYAPEHIPESQGLEKRDLQLFWKRLRKHLQPKRIRYFAAGEYGSKTKRPHYHAIIFNHEFEDKEMYTVRGKYPVFTSETLEKIWQKGRCEIGVLTQESAGYVARYCLKKADDLGEQLFNYETGEILTPEFVTMSRGGRTKEGEQLGGIGKTWLKKYKSDVYPRDHITMDKGKVRPPRFFDNQLDEEELQCYKDNRRLKQIENYEDNTPQRRKVKEKVKKAQLGFIKQLRGDF